MSADKSKEEFTLEKENENVTMAEIEPNEQNVVPQTGIHCNGVQQAPLSCGDEEDVIVNITGNGYVVSGGKGVENNACVDLTDNESTYSSSFGDTIPGLDTGSGSDTDAESPMSSYRRKLPLLRSKRLTAHWRSFISPMVCRAKWLECRLRTLNYLTLKYEKEIAVYNEKKQRELLKFAVDGFDVKSVPKSDAIQSHQVMKRKKRRRAEECNLSSHMSSHRFFSYYEKKNLTPDSSLEIFPDDVMSNADNNEEFKLSDISSIVDHHEDNDKSFFDAIQKVEQLLLHVSNMKARIDNVMNENPEKFCSVTQSSTIGPCDGSNHAGQKSTSLAGNENPNPLPTENTNNQAPEKELPGFENVRNQLVEKPSESDEKPKSISLPSKSGLVTDDAPPRSRSTLKACSRAKSNSSRKVREGKE